MKLVAPLLVLTVLASSASADIVINEIMYHPNTGPEFIELFNTGATVVDLEGWTIADAVSFEFPAGAEIGPGEYAILAGGPLTLPGVTVWSPFERSLSNRAETILLRDASEMTIDNVRYADDGPWPGTADGDGPSLELINPSLENEYPEAWVAGPNGGTPGSANASLTVTPVPFLSGITHTPLVPNTFNVVTVLGTLQTLGETPTVTLRWRVEGAPAFQSVTMSDLGDGTYAGQIPAQADDRVVEYHVEISSSAGSRVQPPTAPAINRLIEFDADALSATPPLYRLVMTQANWDELRSRDPMSNVLLPATVIVSGEAYHGVGLRYRGSNNRVEVPEESFRVNFDDAQPLGGNIRRLNLNGHNPERQWLSMDLFRRAGLLAADTRMASVTADGEFLGPYVQIEEVDEDFLERTLDTDAVPLFRGEETAGLDYRGDIPADYTADYDAITDEADHALLPALTEIFTRPDDAAFLAGLAEQVDVEQWLTFFAVNAVLSNQEGSIYRDTGDDYFLLRHPDTGLWQLLPWDMDSTFIEPTETIFRPTLPPIARMLSHPVMARRYQEIILALLEDEFSTETVEQRVALLPPEVRLDRKWRAVAHTIGRARSIHSQIPSRLEAGAMSLSPNPVWNLEMHLDRSQAIGSGDTWRFLRGSETLPTDWLEPTFDDSGWDEGLLPLGIGDSDDATVLPEMASLYTTIQARRMFIIPDRGQITQLIMTIDYDDGFIAWINGTEVARANVTGNPGVNGTADGVHTAGTPEIINLNDKTNLLETGDNVLAISVFNSGLGDTSVTLDASLRITTRPAFGLIGGDDPIVALSGIAPLPETWSVEFAGTQYPVDPVTGAWQGSAISQRSLNTQSVIARGASGEPLERITARWVYAPEPLEFSGNLPPNQVTEVTAAGGVVRITASSTLPVGSTLRFQPGSVIVFDPFVSLLSYGRVEAFGTPEAPVIFMNAQPGLPWAGLGLAPGSEGALLRGVEVLNGGAGVIDQFNLAGTISCLESDLVFENSAIRFCVDKGIVVHTGTGIIRGSHFSNLAEAINCQGSLASIENCTFIENAGSAPKDPIDIDSDPGPPFWLRNNCMIGGIDDGIDIGLQAQATITGNTIMDFGDKGISLAGGNPTVTHNVITDCGIGMAFKDGALCLFSHNTVDHCEQGLVLAEDRAGRGGAIVFVESSVIWDWILTSFDLDALSSISVYRSDVTGGYPGDGNFDLPPQFTDPESGNYHPQLTSPLIGAGQGGGTVGALEAESRVFDGLVTF